MRQINTNVVQIYLRKNYVLYLITHKIQLEEAVIWRPGVAEVRAAKLSYTGTSVFGWTVQWHECSVIWVRGMRSAISISSASVLALTTTY